MVAVSDSSFAVDVLPSAWTTERLKKFLLKEKDIPKERLHVTSQPLCNHFRVAKEVCYRTHSTRSVYLLVCQV